MRCRRGEGGGLTAARWEHGGAGFYLWGGPEGGFVEEALAEWLFKPVFFSNFVFEAQFQVLEFLADHLQLLRSEYWGKEASFRDLKKLTINLSIWRETQFSTMIGVRDLCLQYPRVPLVTSVSAGSVKLSGPVVPDGGRHTWLRARLGCAGHPAGSAGRPHGQQGTRNLSLRIL